MPHLTCTKCGCTDDRGCRGGCYWVCAEPAVCSACAAKSLAAAGVETTPLLVGLQHLIDRAAARSAGARLYPLDRLPVPFPVIASAVNLLGAVETVFDAGDDVLLAARLDLWGEARQVLGLWDQLAAAGQVPSRPELAEDWAAAGVGPAGDVALYEPAAAYVGPTPIGPRIVLPGDPDWPGEGGV